MPEPSCLGLGLCCSLRWGARPARSQAPPPLCSFVAAGHRCFKGDITRLRKARGVELRALLLVFLERPWALDFHLRGTTGPHVSTEDAAMAEGSELVNRLMIENADLRKQVRLMKENQMLKRLLSESCQESCGRGGCDLLIPKASAYPEACLPCSAGEPGPVSSGGSAPGRRADRLHAWAGGALCPWWPPRCCHRGYKQHVQVHQGQPGGAGGAGPCAPLLSWELGPPGMLSPRPGQLRPPRWPSVKARRLDPTTGVGRAPRRGELQHHQQEVSEEP